MRPLLPLATAGIVLAVASPAAAQNSRRTTVSPYIELDQVVTANLSGDDDATTYTELAAGVDASVQTARAQGQVSARYERHIAWGHDDVDEDYATGLAQASYDVTRHVTLEGRALATRVRSDIRGAAPVLFGGNDLNSSQLYSLYVGPTWAGNAGPVNLSAGYRYGYTKVEAPYATGIGPNDGRLDYFDDSNDHLFQASAGVEPGRLAPFGVTVSGAYERSDAGQLSQRFENRLLRGDVLMPVSRTLAVTAGVGYQHLTISQRDPLVDGAGDPVLDRNGRFVTDPASPRRIDYNTDGLIYDAGVVWKPSPRTTLTATVAHQYGSTSYTGSLTHIFNPSVGGAIVVYDTVDTFGPQVREGLENLPQAFQSQSPGFGQQFNGCVFGSQPGQAQGGIGECLNGIFQSVSTAGYRTRGVDAVLSATRGPNSFGVGAGYANRHLFAPRLLGTGLSVYGVDDEIYYAQAYAAHAIDRVSGIDGDLYLNHYDTQLPGSNGVWGFGATGSYYRNFGRLGTVASLGVYSSKQSDLEALWQAQALLGAQYRF